MFSIRKTVTKDELVRLDEKMARARQGLTLECLRGVLIDWRNSFRFLNSLLTDSSLDRHGDEYAFQVAYYVKDCLSFSYENRYDLVALPDIVADYQAMITDYIKTLSKQNNLKKAISVLIKNDQVSDVVNYINEEITTLETSMATSW